jgi:ribosomal protein S18 acetylase RimI-like enzyme
VRRIVLLDKAIHNRKSFSCAVELLDRYISERASSDVKAGAAVCYVLVDDTDPSAIIGYYTLSSSSLEFDRLPQPLQRPLPKYPRQSATLLGKLAVSADHQKKGYGEILLVDGLRRAAQTSRSIGSSFVIVDALDEDAAGYYQKFGFRRIESAPLKLFLPMATVEKLYEDG